MTTDNSGIILTRPLDLEHYRWITVRGALKLEITTGMRRSASGRSTLQLANDITGSTTKNKVKAYEALNAKIVRVRGERFDRPLSPAAPPPRDICPADEADPRCPVHGF
jgi:hypothetical protein